MFPTQPLQRPLRVVFFGTPEFAAHCMEEVMMSQHILVGVVTAPDRKAGRGQQLQQSAVKSIAIKAGLPVLQPLNLKDDAFNDALAQWNADLFLVVAFRMLPERVWNAPPFGTINLHASLLPQLRGAAPIQWAIRYGFKTTGVTTFSLQHQIDTGDILKQASVHLDPDENASTLHDKLLERGKVLLVETLEDLAKGLLKSTPQSQQVIDGPSLHAPKLNRQNTRIEWSQGVENVKNTINGLSPFPKAWTPTPFGDIKLIKASIPQTLVHYEHTVELGLAVPHHNQLCIWCGDGWVQIDELTPPGKRSMTGGEWLNGLNEQAGIWGIDP